VAFNAGIDQPSLVGMMNKYANEIQVDSTGNLATRYVDKSVNQLASSISPIESGNYAHPRGSSSQGGTPQKSKFGESLANQLSTQSTQANSSLQGQSLPQPEVKVQGEILSHSIQSLTVPSDSNLTSENLAQGKMANWGDVIDDNDYHSVTSSNDDERETGLNNIRQLSQDQYYLPTDQTFSVPEPDRQSKKDRTRERDSNGNNQRAKGTRGEKSTQKYVPNFELTQSRTFENRDSDKRSTAVGYVTSEIIAKAKNIVNSPKAVAAISYAHGIHPDDRIKILHQTLGARKISIYDKVFIAAMTILIVHDRTELSEKTLKDKLIATFI